MRTRCREKGRREVREKEKWRKENGKNEKEIEKEKGRGRKRDMHRRRPRRAVACGRQAAERRGMGQRRGKRGRVRAAEKDGATIEIGHQGGENSGR